MQLADLFPIFDRLEAGHSVALGSDQSQPTPHQPPPSQGPWLGVRSSGSSGTPKLVWRSWAALRSELRLHDTRGWHWASPFRPDSFAGVQAALQAWASNGSITSLDTRWSEVWQHARSHPWHALSATPTYLDLLIQNEPAGTPPPDPIRITLGGEVLRPACGNRLATRFPSTRFSVIYAAAECGVLLKTHRLDGWYEADSLSRRHPGWRLNDGILELPGPAGSWCPTGDRLEQDGPLLRVVGRADRVANVAGTKVNLDEIGRLAEEVPGVLRAVAVATPNPVTGHVVALHFAAPPGISPDHLQDRIAAHLRSTLPKPAWPRLWIPDPLLPGTNAKRSTR